VHTQALPVFDFIQKILSRSAGFMQDYRQDLRENPKLIGAIERLEYWTESKPERGLPCMIQLDANRILLDLFKNPAVLSQILLNLPHMAANSLFLR
jgi:hypothetical protein